MLLDIKSSIHSITISVEYGSLTQILDWCNKNCTGEWSFIDSPDLYSDFINIWCFVFKSEQDFVMFSLKWA